jgi:hypothetical protein
MKLTFSSLEIRDEKRAQLAFAKTTLGQDAQCCCIAPALQRRRSGVARSRRTSSASRNSVGRSFTVDLPCGIANEFVGSLSL